LGTSFTKLRLFFHKISFITKTFFPALRDTMYACHRKLFVEASGLLRHAVFRPQSAILGVHPSVGQKMEVREY
jgi:hypothetical protein